MLNSIDSEAEFGRKAMNDQKLIEELRELAEMWGWEAKFVDGGAVESAESTAFNNCAVGLTAILDAHADISGDKPSVAKRDTERESARIVSEAQLDVLESDLSEGKGISELEVRWLIADVRVLSRALELACKHLIGDGDIAVQSFLREAEAELGAEKGKGKDA